MLFRSVGAVEWEQRRAVSAVGTAFHNAEPLASFISDNKDRKSGVMLCSACYIVSVLRGVELPSWFEHQVCWGCLSSSILS